MNGPRVTAIFYHLDRGDVEKIFYFRSFPATDLQKKSYFGVRQVSFRISRISKSYPEVNSVCSKQKKIIW